MNVGDGFRPNIALSLYLIRDICRFMLSAIPNQVH